MASKKTRREFLQESATLTAGAALGMAASAGVQAARVRNFQEYRSYDAMGLAELVRDGDASPTQLLDIALARAREVNPGINALVAFYDDIARAAIQQGLPEGPFTGVPWLLKDLGLAMKGTVTTNGSVLFKNAMQDYNSTLVTRYRQAGLVIFGKTHSPEFGGTATTESTLFGDTHNPWNLALSAGGSSGGSAAAVAAGILPAAHASDGGGSIRIPASACGLFGMKPTRGRVPMGPKVYETRNGLSVQHAISRSVRDSAALLDISQGAAIGDAYAAPGRERPYLEEIKHSPGKLRVALMIKPLLPVPVAPDCEVAARQAARLCESLGHSVDEASPVLDVETLFNALAVSSNVLVAKKVGQREQILGRKARRDELEPITWVGLEAGRKVTGIQYSEVRDVLHHASRVLGQFMEGYDVILSPTMAILPQPLGVLSLNQPFEDFMMLAAAASSFTSLYNMTGQPAMSVPLYWTEGGVPVGVQFAGRFGDEATLFRLAAQLERASPWFDNVTPA